MEYKMDNTGEQFLDENDLTKTSELQILEGKTKDNDSIKEYVFTFLWIVLFLSILVGLALSVNLIEDKVGG